LLQLQTVFSPGWLRAPRRCLISAKSRLRGNARSADALCLVSSLVTVNHLASSSPLPSKFPTGRHTARWKLLKLVPPQAVSCLRNCPFASNAT
jgi:hypothetical protein